MIVKWTLVKYWFFILGKTCSYTEKQVPYEKGDGHMQTKKSDIEATILDCARKEFLIHGYGDASMRTIAKKANTSLGNIYHYFPNKKALLDTLLIPMMQDVEFVLVEHTRANLKITDLDEINMYLEMADFNSPPLTSLLSEEFVIFMETKEPEYVEKRESLMKVFRMHIAGHMRADESNHFVAIVCKMIIDCVIHLVRCNECVKNKKRDLIDMFTMLCRCVAVNDVMDKDLKIIPPAKKQDK